MMDVLSVDMRVVVGRGWETPYEWAERKRRELTKEGDRG
jgi:hypothetical protein